MNGVLPVNKPKGVSSYDVIRQIQRLVPELRRLKIGHAGTLDPLAEGVLLILLGEATKLFGFLLEHEKTYEVWTQLGVSTATEDAEGEVVGVSDIVPSLSAVEEAVRFFCGKIRQIPPRYSAVRVNGKRAYERARSGEVVDIKPREVEIVSHEMVGYDEEKRLLHTRVRCSSGTYIRSLARDMGERLGCYGYVARLVRTETLGIALGECALLAELDESNWKGWVLPMERMVSLPVLRVKRPEWVGQGRVLCAGDFVSLPSQDGLYQVLEGGRLLAIGEWQGERFFYRRVFHG